MNRRSRKQNARCRSPTADQVQIVLTIIAGLATFCMSGDQRQVVFLPTGKKFWTWDAVSIRAFIQGERYEAI